jgi:hypothetical protein
VKKIEGKKYGKKSTGKEIEGKKIEEKKVMEKSLLVKHAHGITSGCSSSLLHKCDFVRPHILLMSLYRRVSWIKYYILVSNFIPTLSDTHCKLEWELLAKYKQENISYDNILHPNYIWGDVRFTMTLG